MSLHKISKLCLRNLIFVNPKPYRYKLLLLWALIKISTRLLVRTP